MRLIDADAIVSDDPNVIEAINKAPTVENAVVLPYKLGEQLWEADEEDWFKVKPYKDKRDRLAGIAVFDDGSFEIITGDRSMFPSGDGGTCATKGEAEAYREKKLSELTFDEMCQSINYSSRGKPETWEDLRSDFIECFRKKVESLP